MSRNDISTDLEHVLFHILTLKTFRAFSENGRISDHIVAFVSKLLCL